MRSKSPPQWLYYLLCAPFIKPGILGVMEGTELLEKGYDLWRLGAAAVIAVLYVRHCVRSKRGPSPVMLLLGGYLGFVALATLVRENNLWGLANHVLTILTFSMLVELRLREDPKLAVDMLLMPTTVIVLLNFFFECAFPWGLGRGGSYNYSYNYLGIDNLLAPVLVPYMFLVVLGSELHHGKVSMFAVVLVFAAAESLVLIWAATGLMGIAVALVFLLFFYRRRFETWFNFTTAGLVSGGMFFGIVVFRMQNLFAFFIEDVLHKGLSFTGRTDIWDRALFMFDRSPLLGYGIAQTGKVYRLAKHKYYHAHNVYLEVLIEGGVPALIAFLFMLERAGRQLLLFRKHPFACLLSAAWMAVFVMTSMEPYVDRNGLLIYAMVFLSYYVGDLIKASEPCASAGGARLEV